MEEDEDVHPPFWIQTTDTPRSRYRTSSRFLNSGLLLLLLLVIALFFFFVVIPSFLSFTSQIFRPHLVKKSWDSLINLVLVLFAIACGFLSRNTNNNSNNETSSYEDPSILNASLEANKSNPSTPHRWYELYAYQSTAGHNNNNPMINMLRSSSSYPDLRQESAWVTVDERGRFYDDAQVSSHRFPGSDQVHYRHSRREPQAEEEEEEENSETKTIEVDTFVVYTEEFSSGSPPPPLPRAPRPPYSPPQTPPKLVKRRAKRTSNQALGDQYHREKIENLEKNYSEKAKNLQPLQSLPPPPLFQHTEETSTGGKNEKKRSSGGSSGAKDFLSSLRRRKKKQRQKSVENFFDTILEPQPTSYLPLYPPPSPPPPPPPPPPLSSVFHNLFSTKKGKTKKIQSDASPAPPPPPPPARAKTVRAASTTKSGRGPITASKPPLPVKTNSFNGGNGNLRSGNESPLVPIPPSLPPFKMRGWKYVVHSDFVRTKSNTSSRSVSQDLDDDEEGNSSSGASGKDGRVPTTMPMFCPSPDVNTKADTFIAKFRAGLKLEKDEFHQ